MECNPVEVHPLFGEAVLKDIDSRFVLDESAASFLKTQIEEIINTALEQERNDKEKSVKKNSSSLLTSSSA